MADLHQYDLRIDGPLLRKQRQALLDALRLKLADATYESLDGLIALLDEIGDQAHDRYGIDCLLEEPGEAEGEQDPSVCDCQRPGYFCSGVPGVLAHLENGRLPKGDDVERCDLCQRYASDQAALEKLKELGHDPP